MPRKYAGIATIAFILFVLLAFFGYSPTTTTDNALSLDIPPPSTPPGDVRLLVDCDQNVQIDMLINSALCWARVRGMEAAIREFTVWCLSQSCCEQASKLGFRTLGSDGWPAQYRSFRSGFERNGPPTAYLDSIVLQRDLIYHRLIGDGGWLLRADIDSCFVRDPIRFAQDHNLDVFGSAQEVKLTKDNNAGIAVDAKGQPVLPYWAYHWECPGATTPLHLTLNLGVGLLRCTDLTQQHFGLAMGHGFHVMARGVDGITQETHHPIGWGQKGWNIHMHRSGLCLKQIGKPSGINWDGQEVVGSTREPKGPQDPPRLQHGGFAVCSHCDASELCGKEHTYLVHANCLGGDDKLKYLKKTESAWWLREDWRAIELGTIPTLKLFLQAVSTIEMPDYINA